MRPTFPSNYGSEIRQRAEWLASLDPGISPYVDILDSNGVETFESCQGGEGHCFPEPTVRFYGGRAAGWHAVGVALQIGPLPVKALRRYWRIGSDGIPEGPNWEMTFSKTADRVAWATDYVPMLEDA